MPVFQGPIEVPWTLGTKLTHHFFKEVFDGFTIHTASVADSVICPAAGTTRIADHTSLG